jgi:hypothetical protein
MVCMLLLDFISLCWLTTSVTEGMWYIPFIYWYTQNTKFMKRMYCSGNTSILYFPSVGNILIFIWYLRFSWWWRFWLVFWVVMPCSLVRGYQCFWGTSIFRVESRLHGITTQKIKINTSFLYYPLVISYICHINVKVHSYHWRGLVICCQIEKVIMYRTYEIGFM